jgi:preprotein translocase subunit SecF
MEFDLTTVAALLTIVGFSVNDNVVISDRIRENMRKTRRGDLRSILNTAINETLSRTIINSGTVIFVSTALFLLGGSVIHSFHHRHLLVDLRLHTYRAVPGSAQRAAVVGKSAPPGRGCQAPEKWAKFRVS